MEQDDVKMMYEMGAVRHVRRTWEQFGGLPLANVAEHSFRMAWIAWALAIEEGADAAKVIQLCVLHDVAEVRTGDVNYLSRMYVKRDEDGAMADIFAGTAISSAVEELWTELKERSTLEAKIVKDADSLDCDLELMEAHAVGYDLLTALGDTRQQVFERLNTDSARRMFTHIYESDPHAWHKLGRNRMTAGDWQPRK